MITVNKYNNITKLTDGCITSPNGFQADGINAGLKNDQPDLGVIFSEVPAVSAGVYTQSHFQAAPLKVTQESIATEGKLQALVVNSKNANACTGQQGLKDAYEMRASAAKKFGITDHLVAVASTGVIGQLMPMDKINSGIKSLNPAPSKEKAESFNRSILTTDLVIKKTGYQFEIDGKTIKIGAAAKGSGMIHPNMGTMLSFITTDANIEQHALDKALKEITNLSFNRITVDGDTSTNDMAIVMANGLGGNQPLTETHPQWSIFFDALRLTCEDMAKAIARDGEGATKLIEVHVKGAKSNEDAGIVAKQIVGSSLVKTAVYGSDANWGRIICAVGYSDVEVDPENVDIAIGPIEMLKKSQPVTFSEEEALTYLKNETIQIFVDLHVGQGEGKAWGCDLSYDYVKINASYRT